MLRACKAAVVSALISAFILHVPVSAQSTNTFEVSPLVGSSDVFPRVPIKAIRKVKCGTGHGTGVVVAADTMITAHHVINGAKSCKDEETGELLSITHINASQDFAVLKFTTTSQSHWIPVNCGGFNTDQTYYSFGFAGVGASDIMMTRLRATSIFEDGVEVKGKDHFSHMRKLTGVVIPGMSGGPIIDDEGRVVGLNNLTAGGFRYGLSRELKDTYLCAPKGALAKPAS